VGKGKTNLKFFHKSDQTINIKLPRSCGQFFQLSDAIKRSTANYPGAAVNFPSRQMLSISSA